MSSFFPNTEIRAIEWCENMPCAKCGDLVIDQVSSSLIVYTLALLAISVGVIFLKRKTNKAHLFWGLSMLLSGIGALLAGLSFQTFGFELKCRGEVFCLSTSWFEILYNVLTVSSGYLMLIAIGEQLKAKGLKTYKLSAKVFSGMFVVIILIGISLKNHLLLSFEVMGLFCLPAFVLSIAGAIKQEAKYPIISRNIIKGCVILLFVMAIYFCYAAFNITEALWQKGIWFSDNDIFHVGMIAWVLFIWVKFIPIRSIQK